MLPRLQSVIIVLLKTLLQTISTLITQPSGPENFPNGILGTEQNGQSKRASDENADDSEDPSLNDLDTQRVQEIIGKAVSGIIFLLLKWFKVSRK